MGLYQPAAFVPQAGLFYANLNSVKEFAIIHCHVRKKTYLCRPIMSKLKLQWHTGDVLLAKPRLDAARLINI